MASRSIIASASRIDPRGFREEAAFVDAAGARVFSTLHLPEGPVAGCVVVCPPLMSELLANYTNEVMLARSLAARGIAVRRFHYRGTGHSDGASEDVDMEGMVADAVAIAELVQSESGTDTVCFVGTRLASLVASGAARSFPGALLCLWEPCMSGERFVRDLVRALAVLGVSGDPGGPRTIAEFASQIRARGYVDVAGYQIHRTLYDGIERAQLTEILTPEIGGALLVQLGRREGIRAEYAPLVDRCSEMSVPIDVASVDERISWWFHRPVIPAVEQLSAHTVPWIEWQLAGGVAP